MNYGETLGLSLALRNVFLHQLKPSQPMRCGAMTLRNSLLLFGGNSLLVSLWILPRHFAGEFDLGGG
jgi:hypothetical protein